MTFAAEAWGHDGKTYDGKDMRELAALFVDDGVAALSKVFSGLGVTQQAVPAATVRVAAGRAVVGATGAGLFGAYAAWNDASATSPTISPTSTNGRKDRLILRVTSGVPALEVVAGTAAATPLEPSITGDNYLELALITLPPSTTNVTTAMIEDRRVFGGRWAQPWGYVNRGTSTTDTPNGTGGTPGDAALSVAWVPVKGRRYELEVDAHVYNDGSISGVAGGLVTVLVTDSSNNIKRRKDAPSISKTLAQDFSMLDFEDDPYTDGSSITRKVRFYPASATGTAHFFADAARPAYIVVRDIGPYTNPTP